MKPEVLNPSVPKDVLETLLDVLVPSAGNRVGEQVLPSLSLGLGHLVSENPNKPLDDRVFHILPHELATRSKDDRESRMLSRWKACDRQQDEYAGSRQTMAFNRETS